MWGRGHRAAHCPLLGQSGGRSAYHGLYREVQVESVVP